MHTFITIERFYPLNSRLKPKYLYNQRQKQQAAVMIKRSLHTPPT